MKMSLMRCAAACVAVVGLAAMNFVEAAKLAVEKSERGAVVTVDGKLFSEYLIRSHSKPVLYPLIGPTGKSMTRGYPLHTEPAAGEQHDHPHHRSVWIGHGSVNGYDFWLDDESGRHGRIVHREFVQLRAIENRAVIVSRNDWVAPGGKTICEDLRTLTFAAGTNRRWIDFDVKLRATHGKVVFGDTKEGTFALRVAGSLKVNAGQGGRIVDSKGRRDEDVWGKTASWVDYHGRIGGETVGIAILNHPTSFRYPTNWHVRTYGLMAANPFGRSAFGSSDKLDGSHVLEPGESITLRYRVLLHTGDERQGKVADRFVEYATR